MTHAHRVPAAQALTPDDPRLAADGDNCTTCSARIGNKLTDTEDQRVMANEFIPVYGDGHVLYCETCAPVTVTA